NCFYKEFWALKNISVEIKEGEVVGIIGQNGAGKSTLLQLICGTLHQTTGEVIKRGRISALLELGSGFNPEYSGRENVYLNASILGLSKKEIDEKFEDIEKFADIGSFIDQPV
ncbi:ABC transporter ATP-binding protein, partial [Vibrio cholerae]